MFGFPVGHHRSSENEVMSCTTPQSGPHAKELPSARSALSGFRGSAEETWSGKRDTRESEDQEGCETGAVDCENSSWGGRGCFGPVSTSKRKSNKRNTHSAPNYFH